MPALKCIRQTGRSPVRVDRGNNLRPEPPDRKSLPIRPLVLAMNPAGWSIPGVTGPLFTPSQPPFPMPIPAHSLPLELVPGVLAICGLPPEAPLPGWTSGAAFCTVSRTLEELSITIDQARVPPDIRSELNYRAIRVAGVLPPDLIGILVAIGTPLAEAGLPIFAISTFDTDYVLVRMADLETALEALRLAGHRINP